MLIKTYQLAATVKQQVRIKLIAIEPIIGTLTVRQQNWLVNQLFTDATSDISTAIALNLLILWNTHDIEQLKLNLIAQYATQAKLIRHLLQDVRRHLDELILWQKTASGSLIDVQLVTTLAKMPISSNKTVGIIGDSVSFGLKATTNYGQYIQRATGSGVQNLAISGAHLSDNGYNSIYQQAQRLEKAQLYIFQGTDDDWLANVPIGSLTDKPNESYLGAFYHTIKVLKQKNASSKILTLTPTYQVPVKGNKVRRTDETRNKLGHNLHDYVRAQIQASYVLDIPVVNLMQKTLFNPADYQFRQLYMPDGLHPNERGHRIIAKEIATAYNYYFILSENKKSN
ncbi:MULTISPECIES: SGNH/GDSL hydrolase family protein [Leuconostoc]|uniref:SGNH/GDSL hydrolase family protein n=1 Tax=Leuconostoc TaxID=1243 RepID=UPI00024660C0|nr:MULTISPECIES: SGNH/GDSL hydrolase family protein [Leuconostoc]MCJ2166788.1 SGNH/GDSL hydrolase family protein [Leuconostoc citreum]MCS8587818.1 SGNH/GDSL hydrolase family protein [Leuconostoc citreum]MCS8595283.1 SGNH/GDSL hydrolase family protein [Leuconostoc citreum]MCS8599261.1 SGNH/GDSL hydrolase family protein [Leuconostoc citreum]MCT3058536.1 SGNH/GDSL hydrolase family protein [Leuconostoc citreum]